MSVTVSALYIYPVKSMSAVSLSSSQVLPTGLQHDRQWMLVDNKGRFISQREVPKLATINLSVSEKQLQFSHPEFGTIALNTAETDREHLAEFQIWKDTVQAIPEAEEINQWLTEVLGVFRGNRVRLVRFADTAPRPVAQKYLTEQESDLKLADACPFLITCEDSLAKLNEYLPAPMPMDRFRANIVLSGSAPFAEYHWQTLSNHQLNFAMIGPCQRCPMTSIDQTEGVIATPGEPLQTLMKHFPVGDKNLPYFGQHAHLPGKESATIQVGDTLQPSN